MAGSAPYYDNIRWGGPSGLRVPQEAAPATFLVSASPVNGGSAITVSPTQIGSAILLNKAAGTVATLPAATGSGSKYRFVTTVTTTSAKHAIIANGSDYIQGLVIGENGGTCKAFVSGNATNHSLQMPFTGSQPSGGFIGDWFELVDIAVGLWQCTGMFQAGTTPTTPFSTATS